MTSAASSQSQAETTSSDLLRTLAHELRQPLSAIESIAYYLSLILPSDDQRAQTHLGRIQQLVEQANWILSSGVHLGEPSGDAAQPVNLDEVITQTLSEGCPGPAPFELALSGDLPAVLLKPGQGRALVESLLLLFRQAAADQRVTLRTGAGAEGGAMLEMHSQGEALDRGSALGMQCARQIVESHGGSLESSSDNAGIHLRVVLP
jgi:signal transduction histidine kinase